eukprot:TRINITY_DN5749_c0_g1_i1.p1 TRINITY_DN5749_c0_g1~~TRINITY_DN5749_c0_g1_i1.p1  ORF type:complete len:1133 (-),score=359.61 TRINITY_DN5749_c0_g1_i1:58-3456(-)
MQPVPDTRISFPGAEEEVLRLWDRLDAFRTSLKRSEGQPEYSFYDGPPFATGLPHYGHLLAGTIKDTVTRYAHQTGHHVNRRFGWDTHGLPIEFEIDKQLGIKTTEDVVKFGIANYNKECRSIVMRYAEEWKTVVKRMGRWIDMDHPYKTMDLSFMESVWWVFHQMWKQNLVYRGFKVMPFSTACGTPLSNFEAGMNYKNVTDPAVIITFPLEDEPDVSMLAWTTTPWTLPSNLALCVNGDLPYVKIFDETTKKTYIMCEPQLAQLPGKAKHTILERFKGSTLVGKHYVPLFEYFKSEREKGAFRIVADPYVTSDSGTGVVHCAPGFGEDDYRVCLANKVIEKGEKVVCPVDNNGKFTNDIPDFVGVYVKDADKDIMRRLKAAGRVFNVGTVVHSYPICWRSDTPLIYKAVPSWFVAVESIRDQLVENNKQTYWVPEFVKEKRFHNWLEGAHDWAVSRNRFWGTPLPIWTNEDGTEIRVFGSVAKLEKATGKKITDLHRENVDLLEVPSKKNPGKMLHRVNEVFDCWFESGSMPYGQLHYPFENKELFESSFPADFIAEGIDQTRGWFYTLLVVSTALFKKPPFKNLVVNGLVLASDGQKMSKRKKNYPDPMTVVDQFGADALRLYLINSPVVHGDTLKFQEKGVKDLLAPVFLPWFNAYRFFVQNCNNYFTEHGEAFTPSLEDARVNGNIMDKWLLSFTQSLIKFVRTEMQLYRLYTVVPRLVDFISEFTNWYVRLNRARIKGTAGKDACHVSLTVLFAVLETLCRAMAPFTPFFAEHVYQGIRFAIPADRREDSVHFTSFPTAWEEAIDPRIEAKVGALQAVIGLGRTIRDRRNLPVKQPLRKLTVISGDAQLLADLHELEGYIKSELNIAELELTQDEAHYVRLRAEPDRAKLGKRLRKDATAVYKAVAAMTAAEIKQFQAAGKTTLSGHEITAEEVQVVREFMGAADKQEAAWEKEFLVVLDLEVDEQMRNRGLAREVVNKIQKLRKRVGVQPSDPVDVYFAVEPAAGVVVPAIAASKEYLKSALGFLPVNAASRPAHTVLLGEEGVQLKGAAEKLTMWLTVQSFGLKNLTATYPKLASAIELYVATRDHKQLAETLQQNGSYTFVLNDTPVTLRLGVDVFLTVAESL